MPVTETPTLSAARRGAPLQVTTVSADLPLSVRRRLAEHGIRPGALVTVAHRSVGGGRVVSVARTSIALDRTTVCAIGVCDASCRLEERSPEPA